MTEIAETNHRATSGVSRFFHKLKALDDAANTDPVERSVDRLNRKIDVLEHRIRELQGGGTDAI